MAHINNIYDSDLYYIFHLVLGEPAKDIHEWKKQLPLLQVCRQWYDMLRGYVFSPGFVIIDDLNGPCGSRYDSESYVHLSKDDTKSCVYYADDNFVCRSNLGIITGRDEHNCNCVTKLNVFISSDHIRKYGPVSKELLTLGVGYWLNLTSLRIYIRGIIPVIGSNELEPKELALTVSKQILDFKRNAPNITRLHLNCSNDRVLSSALSILIDEYADRLQYLHCWSPIKHIPPSFTDALTHLSLDLYKTTTRIPYIYAKSLQHLDLRDIPGAFSWWSFHDHLTPGYIEFTNLEILKLGYLSQTDEEKKLSIKYSKQARPYGCHMLRFPKLSKLFLAKCPVDCDVLFTDMISTHIKRLDILGNSDSIASVSKLQFSKIDELSIVFLPHHTISDDFYDAVDYFFKTVEIVSRCKLQIALAPNIQQASTWTNLTSLEIQDIAFEGLLRLVPIFYNLKIFKASYIYLGNESMSIIRRGLEEEEQERVDNLYTRIIDLHISGVQPDSSQNFLVCINYFLVRMPNIERFQTYPYARSTVSQSFLPEKFQNVVFEYHYF